MRISRTSLLVAAAFLGAGLLTYGSSLKNDFVIWDDDSLILTNPIVADINMRTIKAAFTTYDPELYVPLTFISFQIEHALFGFDAFFYHLDNLLLHILNALLVAALLFRLGVRRWTAIGLGAVFLLHPLNTEAVAWASARKDLLSAVFLLASALCYLRWRREGAERWYELSVIAALLSLLTKAVAVMLPPGLFALDLARARRWSRGDVFRYLPFVALSAAFLFIGLLGKSTNIASLTPWQTLLMSARALAAYPLMLLWPAELSIIYQQTTPITIVSAEFFLPLAACTAVAALALWSLRRTNVVAAGLLWYIAFLLPSFANFVKAGSAYALSDRYPYVAQIGLLLIAGAAIDALRRRGFSKVVAAAAACVLLALGSAAHLRSRVWADSEALFRDALEKNEASYAMHHNLGDLARLRGDLDEAEREFSRALELNPRHVDAYRGMAAVLRARGDRKGALAFMRSAVEVQPENAEALTGLAELLLDDGAVAEAVTLLERAVAQRPGYADAHAALGAAYGRLGRYEEGVRALSEAQRLRDVQGR